MEQTQPLIQAEARLTTLERFGLLVKKLRNNRQWSQAALAASMEIHLNSLSSIERGEKIINLMMLIRLAKAFDMTLPELLKDFK